MDSWVIRARACARGPTRQQIYSCDLRGCGMRTGSVWVTHGQTVRIEGQLPTNAASVLPQRGAFRQDGSWWCKAQDWPGVERVLRAMGVVIGEDGKPMAPGQQTTVGKEALFEIGSLGDIGAFGDMPPKMDDLWLGKVRNRNYTGISPYAIKACVASYRDQGLAVEVRPQVQALMDRIDAMGHSMDLLLKAKVLPDVRMHDKPLWDFQRRAIAFGDMAGGRFFLADEPGLGKSRTAIGYARHVGAQRILVLGPSVSKGNWRDEITAADGRPVQVLSGRHNQPISKDTAYVVVNYDILQDHQQALLDWNPSMVVCDESHALKSREARRSVAAKHLCRKARYCMLLSGTPMTNTPADLWNQLDLVQPRWWGDYVEFTIAFAGGRDTRFGFRPTRSTNAEVLHARLRYVMIRRLKSEVSIEMPRKTRSMYPVDLHPSAVLKYKELSDEYLKWLRIRQHGDDDEQARAQTKLLVLDGKMRQVSSVGRVGPTVDLVEQFVLEGKAPVVFGFFTQPLHAIRDALRTRGMNVSFIDGNVPDADRDRAKLEFLERRADVMVGQITAAGKSINLQKRSDLTITHDFIWDPTEHVQSEDRVNRAESSSDRTMHIYMAAEGTVEMRVLRRMLTKMGVHKGILEQGRDFTDEMLDGLQDEFFS